MYIYIYIISEKMNEREISTRKICVTEQIRRDE